MCGFSYACSLLVTWQRWRSHHSVAVVENHMLYANLIALSVIELELWATKFYIEGIRIFNLFGSCDLDLNPMTFIYQLNLYPLETYGMCENECPLSRLSNVIVWQTYRQTDKLCVVTFGHVTKMAVTPRIRNTQKPHGTCKRHCPICYRMGDQSLRCGNRHFRPFLLPWPWPWPNDLHVRIWSIFPGDTTDVQIWTSYVKAIESYRLTDKQKESTKIIQHASSQVLNNL